MDAETPPVSAAARDDRAASLLRPAYRNYVLLIIAIGHAFAFLDRQIVTILLPPIKAELKVSDASLGVMSGLAFAVVYSTFGIPLGRLADRWSRRHLAAISIAAWSVLSAAGGIVQTFPQLVIARFGVGLGEAGWSPSVFSLIADYFTRAQRQTATALVNIGPQVGMMLGLIIGGLAAPVIGWRGALFVAGAPGLLFAVLFWLTVKEPPRGLADGVPPPKEAPPPFFSSLAALWRIRSYRYAVLANAGFSFSLFAQSVWMPSLMVRTHGLALPMVGVLLSVATAFGTIGTALGGVIGDRLYKRDPRLSLLLPAVGGVLAFPLAAAAALAPSATLSIVFLAATMSAANLFIGPLFALTISAAPPRLRSFGFSFLMLSTSVIGLGLGPAAVGAVSDFLAPQLGTGSLRQALALLSCAFLIPVVLVWLASRAVRGDLDAAANLSSSGTPSTH